MNLKTLFQSEIFQYALWGGLSTLLNLAIFYFLLFFEINYIIINLIAFVIVKLFVYLTNKKWVFQSITPTFSDYIKEFCRFLISRGFTSVLDFAGLIILVDVLEMNIMASKIALIILIVIINFFTSKFYVFKN